MPTLFRQELRAKMDYQPILIERTLQGEQLSEFHPDMSPITVQDEAPHILVIDDDDRIRSLLQRYLTDQGLRVTVAENAETARRFMNTLAF